MELSVSLIDSALAVFANEDVYHIHERPHGWFEIYLNERFIRYSEIDAAIWELAGVIATKEVGDEAAYDLRGIYYGMLRDLYSDELEAHGMIEEEEEEDEYDPNEIGW